MTPIHHPKTPGNAFTAQKAVHYLKGQLLDFGIYSFEWPQDLDSGIDIVAFATLRDENPEKDGRATAFIAGFQSKGTKDAFGDNAKRSVKTGKHISYWLSATLPVFVVAVDTTSGQTLVEDAGSFYHINSLGMRHGLELKSIPTEISLEAASTDIRLRMFAHALAPWVSMKLRARKIADRAPGHGLNVQSPWSLLDYISGPGASIPVPGSWNEIRQYFALIEYMLQDAVFFQQLAEDLRIGTSSETAEFLSKRYEDCFNDDIDDDWSEFNEKANQEASEPQIGAVRLLVGCLELFTKYPSKFHLPKNTHITKKEIQRLTSSKNDKQKPSKKSSYEENVEFMAKDDDFRDPGSGLLREDLDASIDIIVDFWNRSAASQDLSVSALAKKIDELGLSIGNYAEGAKILGTMSRSSESLKTILRRSVAERVIDRLDVYHWTDVVGPHRLVPRPHECSQSDDANFRSYADYLREVNSRKSTSQ
ncbi:DUF4365 domain-containing protein [Arthrobacter sp. YC-RL1]|uniref:DUF4365 domain-containing protein n=1 Tax=Arthrobacter sp. YC-RL1 TaxID=1652545 RepID=UPI000B13E7CA|nr:DUF4365 domain-containing protein [Arthrobacter sp. YC-RL1]